MCCSEFIQCVAAQNRYRLAGFQQWSSRFERSWMVPPWDDVFKFRRARLSIHASAPRNFVATTIRGHEAAQAPIQLRSFCICNVLGAMGDWCASCVGERMLRITTIEM